MYDIRKQKIKAKQSEASTKKFFKQVKKSKFKKLDVVVNELHIATFKRIDCLSCANCCKTISPIITDKDIERISKHLKLKPGILIDKYLRIDSDNDYVFRIAPCPFLLPDNYCSIYDVRPKSCKEYPHTDRNKFHQIINLSIKNTYVCPAVYDIFEELKTNYAKEL